MEDWKIYFLVVPAALLMGALAGWLIANYMLKKQVKEWQKKMEKPDKEKVRNMLSALGKKPSEEQVNRFINMAKNSEKKSDNKSKKKPLKKTKIKK